MLATRSDTFRTTGIQVFEDCLTSEELSELCNLCDPLLRTSDRRRPGVRRVLEKEPRVLPLLHRSRVGRIMLDACGQHARIVRAILFDKTPETNWLVPWHQDASIAVAERRAVAGFGPWAIKDGEHHCQPPRHVLEALVTIRINLDPCPREAGPLRVIVGSHVHGLLDESTMAEHVRVGECREAISGPGAVVLTSPLSIHSSLKSTLSGARRRVLHLDCTSIKLPGGLQFAEAV